jgi:two-component system invasion response regulator UvrY
MIRILIADDHPVVRKGIKQILAETSDIIVADEATTGREVLDKAPIDHFDVILLDIALPDISGLDVLKQLKTSQPEQNVLILSIYPEEQYAARLLSLGAAGYLTKSSAPDELLTAIRKVAGGRKYVSSNLAEKMACDLQIGAKKQPHEVLSNREYQVMLMIASAKTIKEIASDLSLSVKTVSTYRSRILEKMGMKSNAQITRYALENGLIY